MSTAPEDARSAPWWPELLAIKDTLSYAALSDRFGLPVYALRRALELAGQTKVSMPRGPKPRSSLAPSATPELPAPDERAPLDRVRAQVGRIPDAKVAQLAGVPVDEVKAYRREHSIAPFLRPPPSLGIAPKVEPPPSPRIHTAVSEPVVLRRRVTADGPPTATFRRPPARLEPEPEPVRSQPAPVLVASPLAAFHDRLGKVADQVVADEAGIARTKVGDYRRKLGIAAYDGFRHRTGEARKSPRSNATEDGGPNRSTIEPVVEAAPVERETAEPGSHRVSKLDEHLDIVGVLADAEVASRTGMTSEGVRMYRKRQGIPARDRAATPPPQAARRAPEAVEPPTVSPTVAAAVAPPPEAVQEVPAAAAVRAFGIVALRGEATHRFVCVGTDITDALVRAVSALSARADGPWRIRSIRDLAEALTAPPAVPRPQRAPAEEVTPAAPPAVAMATEQTHPPTFTGADLRAYRLAHGLSQIALASQLGTGQAALSRAECATNTSLPSGMLTAFRKLRLAEGDV